MCLLISFFLFGPRIVGVIWWLADSARWTLAFGVDNFLVPALGILLLPWTTVMFVLVAPEGVTGLDIVGMIAAVIIDVGSYMGGGVEGRNRRTSSYKSCQ